MALGFLYCLPKNIYGIHVFSENKKKTRRSQVLQHLQFTIVNIERNIFNGVYSL